LCVINEAENGEQKLQNKGNISKGGFWEVKKRISTFLGLVMCIIMLASIMSPIAQFAQAQDYTLTVLNPKAEVERIPITPLAERLDTFIGKKIAFYNLSIEANMAAIRTIMTERFGASGTQVTYGALSAKSGVGLTDNYTNYESGARVADAVIIGTAY